MAIYLHSHGVDYSRKFLKQEFLVETVQKIGKITLMRYLWSLKMIPGCRQAFSTLPDAFLIFIATYFNLHLPKFAKSHYLFECNRRQTFFFEIKCLELYK